MNKETITWISANGTELLLTDNQSYEILIGTKGFFMPPISYVEESVPFQAGSRLRNVNITPREIDVPIFIDAEDEVELLKNIRFLTRAVNPIIGEGRFRILSVDGSQRELSCRYVSGLEIEDTKETRGSTWQKVLLVFRAFDPFWYDTASNVQTFKLNESPGLFFPILPLRLASSTVFADITIDNTGDIETWPEWIITGPGENIVLRNMTTREVMSLDVSLEVGETLTIDTKPFQKTVTKNDGTNLFYTLTDESSLWSLQEGSNSIQIEMANATSESSIQLTYRNRYWGP